MVLYEVMKFCYLDDQSQFETSNLNSHRTDTENTPWLGFKYLILTGKGS